MLQWVTATLGADGIASAVLLRADLVPEVQSIRDGFEARAAALAERFRDSRSEMFMPRS